MGTKGKILFIGGALCVLGAGFDSAPVTAIGIVLVLAGIVMSLRGRL